MSLNDWLLMCKTFILTGSFFINEFRLAVGRGNRASPSLFLSGFDNRRDHLLNDVNP